MGLRDAWVMLPGAAHSKGPPLTGQLAPGGAHLSPLTTSSLVFRWGYLFLKGIPLIYYVNTMASTSQLLKSP